MTRIFFTPALAALIAFFVLNSAATAQASCVMPLPNVISKTQPAEEAVFQAAMRTMYKDYKNAISNFKNCLSTTAATPEQIGKKDNLIAMADYLIDKFSADIRLTVQAYKSRVAK